MPSVALVLGAGGVVGVAWHAGVLAALAEAGWDARKADLVVGTSAGSVTGAMLRAGLPPLDLFRGVCGQPMSDEGRAIAERAGPPPQGSVIPDDRAAALPFPPIPAEPLLGVRSVLAGTVPRWSTAVAGLLPTGRVPTEPIGVRIHRLHGDTWPEQPYWACALRLRDGRRVVFGRDVIDAPVATAVEASSAIPGFFEPVTFDGERYVDGGAHSPTNADLVAGLGFDLVIVSSPMSATSSALRIRPFPARPLHARRLADEVATVRHDGTAVLVLQPDVGAVRAMGVRAMDQTRRRPVAEAAHASVARHLARPGIAARLP